jgi:hypothetical protein
VGFFAQDNSCASFDEQNPEFFPLDPTAIICVTIGGKAGKAASCAAAPLSADVMRVNEDLRVALRIHISNYTSPPSYHHFTTTMSTYPSASSIIAESFTNPTLALPTLSD